MAEKGWVGSMRDLGQDLITIEVNTIESTEISGRKMPSYPHAMLDVAQKYAKFLVKPPIGLNLDALAKAFMKQTDLPEGKEFDLVSPLSYHQRVAYRKKGDKVLDETMSGIMRKVHPEYTAGRESHLVKLTNGWETFELLRWAANKIIAPEVYAGAKEQEGARQADRSLSVSTGRPPLDSKTRGILWRIARNCDQLKVVADDLIAEELRHDKEKESSDFIGKTRLDLVNSDKTPGAVPPLHLTRIRKAWDIGTDVIVMQTVVQLDGDMTFRTWPNLASEKKSALLDAHERVTNVGVQHWQSLFQLVFNLLYKGIGKVFSGRA